MPCFFHDAVSSLRSRRGRKLAALLSVCAIATAGCASATAGSADGPASGSGTTQQQRMANANANLDPGTSLGGTPAPNFSLVNQFGQRMSLSQFRGKVVILAFVDSQCTTVCPLTTQSMLAAKQLLGQAGDQVQLLGVNANPTANAVSDVMAYSQAHGLVNHWDFLTGAVSQLKAVWKKYGVYAQVVAGLVNHTPAIYIISPQGREEKVYLTSMAYASIGQAGQVMAQEAASLLPGHPKVASKLSLAYISGITPKSRTTLATLPSGSITLGPGQPHLVVFFATWLNETSDLPARLAGLTQYARSAHANRLPGLVAVDEESTEPSIATVRAYLARLGPLGFPVALDTTGRLADGYGVQDQPWYVLTDASGKIIWHHGGWLSTAQLTADVHRAMG